MKKGDKVIIYSDPVTRKDAEGEAVLVEKISDKGYYQGLKIEYWYVRFIGDKETYMRFIHFKEGE